MSVHILQGDDIASLYCSTSDWSFGPVFYSDKQHSAEERAEAFLRWLRPVDARELPDTELERFYISWLGQEEKQYEKEQADERAMESA